MSEPDNPDTESDLPVGTRVSFSKTGGKIQIAGKINSGKAYVVKADNDGSLRVILRKDLIVQARKAWAIIDDEANRDPSQDLG